MIANIAYNKDNYAYFVETQDYNLLVDAGNFDEISAYLDKHNKKPDYILLTHSHADHIDGALALKEKYGALIIASQNSPLHFADKNESQTHELGLSFLPTAGHTEDSGLWILNDKEATPLAIFCGDVLFSCGCGRQFQGIGETLYKAMKAISQLDGRYMLCCGHEYTETNLAFCRQYFPQDSALHNYAFELQTKLMGNQPSLPIALSKEKSINPFLRFDDKELQMALSCTDALSFLMKLRKLRDEFS